MIIIHIDHRVPYENSTVRHDEERLQKMKEIRDKEVKMYGILKEIFAYLFYLAIVCTLGYDNKDTRSFSYKDQIYQSFVVGTGKFETVNININNKYYLYKLYNKNHYFFPSR